MGPIPALARHAVCKITHQGTGALLYGILVRMPVHKHVTFVVFNLLIAWDLPADSGIRIRAEESETTMLYYSCSTCNVEKYVLFSSPTVSQRPSTV